MFAKTTMELMSMGHGGINQVYLSGNQKRIAELILILESGVYKDKILKINVNDIKVTDLDNVEMVIITDLENIKLDFQKQFIEIFNIIYERKIRLIVCSTQSLDTLELNENLKSKLSWGITIDAE